MPALRLLISKHSLQTFKSHYSRFKESNPMRNNLLLPALLAVGLMATGCANVEQKFGRGMANTLDIARGGEFRRTLEQTALFDSPDAAYTTGAVRGINRTLARTGIGI